MKRVIGLSALLIIYATAFVAGIFLFMLFERLGVNEYIAILLADVIATVIVWASGVILRTASAYDPYWSLQTLAIYLCLLFKYLFFTELFAEYSILYPNPLNIGKAMRLSGFEYKLSNDGKLLS